jgi:hypothetical protein
MLCRWPIQAMSQMHDTWPIQVKLSSMEQFKCNFFLCLLLWFLPTKLEWRCHTQITDNVSKTYLWNSYNHHCWQDQNLCYIKKWSKELKIHANWAKLFFTWLQMTLILFVLLGWITYGKALDVWVQPVHNSPGIYYQHEGKVNLYSSEW